VTADSSCTVWPPPRPAGPAIGLGIGLGIGPAIGLGIGPGIGLGIGGAGDARQHRASA